MYKIYGLILALLVTSLVVCSCQVGDEARTVATVNGEKITLDEFNEKLTSELNVSGDHSSLNKEDYYRLKEEMLNSMIDEKIMLLRAGELKITVNDEELVKKIEDIKEGYSADGFKKVIDNHGVQYYAWKKGLKTRMILEKLIASEAFAGVSVTRQEAAAYYHTHKKEYAPQRKVHIAQIVLRDQDKAEKILNRLKKGEEFGKVAREASIGPEASNGGDLGFVSRGVMPEAIDTVIFSLPRGAISQVIRSPYGYHIFRIIEKEDRGKFSDIMEKVISDMRRQKEEQAYVLWLSGLRSRAAIKIESAILKMGTVSEGRQRQ
jgi:peptidyl-prolyl cis-trans isomerase C